MKKYFVIGTLFSLFFVGCANLKPSPFTAKKAMQLKTYLHSDKIVEMFGEPDSISVTSCGGTYGETWACTIWYYKVFNQYRDNAFYFQQYKGDLYLNSWNIYEIKK